MIHRLKSYLLGQTKEKLAGFICILSLVVSSGGLLGSKAFLNHIAENEVQENQSLLEVSKNNLGLLPVIGTVAHYEPLLKNGSFGIEIAGTMVTLEDGQTIGVGGSIHSVPAGTVVHKAERHNKVIYCLHNTSTYCAFEQKLNKV